MWARTEPTPAPTRLWPISEPAGHEGLAISCRPLFDFATAIAESGHLPTPASLPSTPGGNTAEKRVMSCSPSFLCRRMSKGEKEPALLLIEPAEKSGLKPGVASGGHGPPPIPWTIWKEVVLVILWLRPDH